MVEAPTLRTRRRAGLTLATAIALLTMACDKSTTDPGPPAATCQVTAVSVTSGGASVAVGRTIALTATVTQTGCASFTVVWASSDESVARVDASGIVTGVKVGAATITATVNTVAGQFALSVTPAPLEFEAGRAIVTGTGDVPGGDIAAVWALDASNVFVASGSSVFRYDGTRWTRIKTGTLLVNGLWGIGSSNVFAVSDNTRIERWDGNAWTLQTTPGNIRLNAVSGVSFNFAIAVGAGGTILRFDGTSWTAMNSGTTQDLFAVHVLASDLAFAVGANGTILRFNGTNWSAQAQLTNSTLRGVWGAASNDVWAVGGFGETYRFNGVNWTQGPALGIEILRGIWGDGPNDIYVVGINGFAARWNGAAWTAFDPGTGHSLLAVAGSRGTAFAVGENTVVQLQQGLFQRRLAYSPSLHSVWAWNENNAVAVGDDGAVWRYTSGTWSHSTIGAYHELFGVWASGPNEIIAGGGRFPTNDRAIVARWNGSTWRIDTLTTAAFLGFKGSAANSLVGVGFSGVSRFDGAAWTTTSAGGILRAVWGIDANSGFASGDGGRIGWYNGNAWTPLTSGTTQQIRGLWASGANSAFAATTATTLLRYNGTAWTSSTAPTSGLSAIWGRSDTDVFVVTWGGAVLRWDGSAWAMVRPPDNQALNAIHGAGNRLFAVGDAGRTVVTR